MCESVNGIPISDLIDALGNRSWMVTLLPTEECNLRCTYCYTYFLEGAMRPSIVEAIKKLLEIRLRAEDLKSFHLNWFGGEPLLELPIIYELNKFSQKQCRDYQTSFSSSITSNGYLLTRDVFKDLVTLDVNHYCISLDGPKIVHDTTRTTKNHHGTFARIWNNLIEIRKLNIDFTMILRLQIHHKNIDLMPELIKNVDTLIGQDSRFQVHLVPISKFGGPNDDLPDVFPPIISSEEWPLIQNRLSSYFSKTIPLCSAEPKICQAARLNALTIRANGDLIRCIACPQEPINNIGKINNDGSLKIYQDKLNNWLAGFQKIDYDKLTCPYFNFLQKTR